MSGRVLWRSEIELEELYNAGSDNDVLRDDTIYEIQKSMMWDCVDFTDRSYE